MITNIWAKITAFFYGQQLNRKIVLNPYARKDQPDNFVHSQKKYAIKVERTKQKIIDLTNESQKSKEKIHFELKRLEIQQQSNNNDYQTSQDQNLIQQIQELENGTRQIQKLILKLQARNEYVQMKQTNFRYQSSVNKQSQMVDQNEQSEESSASNSYVQDYIKDVSNLLGKKYSGQFIDYPQITFQQYNYIRSLWASPKSKSNDNQIIKQMRILKMIQKLTLKTVKTINFGCWLNDEAINGYLQLMQNKMQTFSNIKIFNSFFAITTLSKSPEMIQRNLRKKNITNKDVILIAMNTGNHWFFTKIKNGRVYIYDSVRKDNSNYLEMEVQKVYIFQNILKFASWFYKEDHRIQISLNYPQQSNGYDCGMFLLCGIKDTYRNYNQWSFSQADIRYKRVLLAKQLINQQISGFNS